jgi:hypothetical protein
MCSSAGYQHKHILLVRYIKAVGQVLAHKTISCNITVAHHPIHVDMVVTHHLCLHVICIYMFSCLWVLFCDICVCVTWLFMLYAFINCSASTSDGKVQLSLVLEICCRTINWTLGSVLPLS